MLKLSDSLSLPLDAATQTFAFIGRKGSGKTYAAGKLAEMLIDAGVQTIILDLVGKWWGLRLAADGKGPGIDIPMLGGLRGDIPLEAAGGALIADALLESGRSAILDVSQFSKAGRQEFAFKFGQRLWQAQKAQMNPAPIHLVIEESQIVVPQKLSAGGKEFLAQMYGIYEEIIRLGRNYGIGVTMITQRPQSVAKEVLNQAEPLLVFQVTAKHERTAVKEWIQHQGMDENLTDTLPAMKNGQCWFWSPEWLGKLVQIKVAAKRTFDSTATPKVGDRGPKARAIKPLDLTDLRDKMAAQIAKAKADDPRELKKKIAEQAALIKKLEARPAAKAEPKIIEKPVVREQDFKALHKVVDNLAVVVCSIREQVEAITGPVRTLEAAVATAHKAANAEMYQPKGKPDVFPIRFRQPKPQPTTTTNYATKNFNGNGAPLGNSGKRRILIALAQHLGDRGLTRTKLSILTGISQRGGTWRTYMGELRGAGYVKDLPDGNIRITSEGLAVLGDHDPLPIGDALIDYWRQRLGDSGKRRLLDAVVAAYPRALSHDELSERSGIDRGGGTWRTYLGELRGLELIEGGRGEARAAACLFD